MLKVTTNELWPIYELADASDSDAGVDYEVEVEGEIEREYFDSLAAFRRARDRMKAAIEDQIEAQQDKRRGILKTLMKTI